MANLGKPVKGKSKRLAKAEKKGGASDAERRLQMRVQKMKENDFRLRIWQKRRAELKASLHREQKHARMNLLKIQNQWRKVMRLAKVQSLRRDIDVLAQSHERDVDRKDAIIQMLDRDLEEAEEQYQMALRNHLSNCDQLIELQDSRILALEDDFTKELGAMEHEFEGEREQIITQETRESQELQDIISAVGNQEKEREIERKHEHEQNREEIRNKNLEDINVLRITLENLIEDLEKSFEQAHMQYLQNTDEQTQEFKNLTRTDQELSKQIDHKIRRIERLQAGRNHWLAKIKQNTKECEERNTALAEEKQQIVAHFQELKSRMNRFRQDQARRLTTLTKSARKCKAALVKKRDLADRIMKLAELARKYETEREKVLPFATATNTGAVGGARGEAAGDVAVAASEVADLKAQTQMAFKGEGAEAGSAFAPVVRDSEGNIVEEWNYLDNFYKKFNKVFLDKLAAEREKERLMRENQDLQSILKQYLDGISVNQDVLDGNNPLLVVNGRLKLNRQPVRRRVHPVTLSAAHMVNTGRVGTGPL